MYFSNFGTCQEMLKIIQVDFRKYYIANYYYYTPGQTYTYVFRPQKGLRQPHCSGPHPTSQPLPDGNVVV